MANIKRLIHPFWLLAVVALLNSATVHAEMLALPGALPVSAEELDAASGRQGIPIQWQVNEADQRAELSDNVLNGTITTGDNLISDHAFDHMNGVATVIQNTGNQVVIQDSTQINILINQ